MHTVFNIKSYNEMLWLECKSMSDEHITSRENWITLFHDLLECRLFSIAFHPHLTFQQNAAYRSSQRTDWDLDIDQQSTVQNLKTLNICTTSWQDYNAMYAALQIDSSVPRSEMGKNTPVGQPSRPCRTMPRWMYLSHVSNWKCQFDSIARDLHFENLWHLTGISSTGSRFSGDSIRS